MDKTLESFVHVPLHRDQIFVEASILSAGSRKVQYTTDGKKVAKTTKNRILRLSIEDVEEGDGHCGDCF